MRARRRRVAATVLVAAAAAAAAGVLWLGGADGPSVARPQAVPDVRAREVAMAIDASGTTHAAWAPRHPGGHPTVHAAQRAAGGDWGAAEQIAPPSVWQVGRLRLAASPAGHLLVSHTLSAGRRTVPRAIWRDADGRWQEPQTVGRATVAVIDPVPARADDGAAAVAWLPTAVGPARRVRVAARPAGGDWRDPVMASRHPSQGGYSLGPLTAGSGDTICMLAWWGRSLAPYPAALIPDVRCLGPDGHLRPVPMPAGLHGDGSPGVLVAHAGGFTMAWSAAEGRQATVRAVRLSPGGPPSAVRVLDRSPHRFGAISAAPVDDGVLVGWTRWEQPWQRVSLRATTLDTGMDAATPATVASLSEVAPRPEGYEDGPLLAPPGLLTAGGGEAGALMWSSGGFPNEELEDDLRLGVPSGGGWRTAPVPTGGSPVRPLAVRMNRDVVAAWTRHRSPGWGADAVPVGATVPHPG